jgi:hypothetical protein
MVVPTIFFVCFDMETFSEVVNKRKTAIRVV